MFIKKLIFKESISIKELTLFPKGINIVSGGNAQGKSSILDSIAKLVKNEDRRPRFVRIGADEAIMYMETDTGLTALRLVGTDNKTRKVEVVEDGRRINTAETYLKSLIGKDNFGFNLIEFILADDKKQTEILLRLLPIRVTREDLVEWFEGEIPPVDLTQHGLQVMKDLANEKGGYWYEKRAFVNQEVSTIEARINSLEKELPPNYKADLWRNVSLNEIHKQIQAGTTINNYRVSASKLCEGLDAALQNINNKYDLQIKDAEELKEFKTSKIVKEIEGQKQEIQDDITILETEISGHEKKIQDLLKEIEVEKQTISSVKNEIKLKQKDLDNFDNSILVTKTESLTNEMNIAVKSINEARNKELAAAEERKANAQKYLDDNPIVDVAPLETQAEEVEKMKGFIQLSDSKTGQETLLAEKEAIAEKYNRFVAIARKKPAELLAQTRMPVPGLGVDGNMNVTINGLPIKNLSGKERVMLALTIVVAVCESGDGELKLILVDNFESLDPEMQAEFYLQAEEYVKQGYQFFVAEVTSGDLAIESTDHVMTEAEKEEAKLKEIIFGSQTCTPAGS